MKSLQILLFIILAFLIMLTAGCYPFAPSKEAECGNYVLESGEECEVIGHCDYIEGKIRSCVECKCEYKDLIPSSRPECGNEIIEGGEECDPPDSLCDNGEKCTAECACPVPASEENGEIKCPADKDVSWTQYCLPGLSGNVKEKFSNENGAGWIACFGIPLSQAHQKGECTYIQTTDPACDEWEGCNAQECHTMVCDYETIPCVTHYHYVIVEYFGEKFCKPQITQECEAECNCAEDEDATYIECPDENCEADCPYISEPGPGPILGIGGTA